MPKPIKQREDAIRTKYNLAIALVAGAAVGGGAIQQLQAQMKPPTPHRVVGAKSLTGLTKPSFD